MVFDGPEDYHARIDDPALGADEHTILIMRGAGPVGYPGAAEVVNMRPPASLLKAGINALPCVGDGRQSGTSGSPSILNASPEAAVGGGLALLKTGDRVRIDLTQGHGQYADRRRGAGASAARNWKRPAATNIPPRRRPGRKSSASMSARWAPAWCWKMRSSIRRSTRPWAFRGIITNQTTMGGLESTIQRHAKSKALRYWMAGSKPGHGEWKRKKAPDFSGALFCFSPLRLRSP